jgi:hypothetical protein
VNSSSDLSTVATAAASAQAPAWWREPLNLLAQNQRRLRLLAWAGLGVWLLWGGLRYAPGPFDNDWPLLMWLVKHASLRDPSPLAIGHYGPLQLLLAWWLYPVLGSTLVAAKVLSALGVLGGVACLYRMTRRDHGEAAALMAATAFALSASALETGQSEFADAPACGLFLAGLWLWWRAEGTGKGSRLLAGALLGCAGLMRTHFVFFSIGAALLAALLGVCLPAGGSRRASARAGAVLVLGAVLGNLPGMALNWWVHGQLGSAVASTFVGQVLYGMDELNLLETYALHPLGEILRERPGDILSLMAKRGEELSGMWWTPLIAAVLACWRWRVWPAPVLRHVLFFSALSFVYFWLVISLAWWPSPRSLLPITSFNCWLIVVVSSQLFWGAFPRSRVAYCAAFALVLAVQMPETLDAVKARWRESRAWWQVSTELVQALRGNGMRDAREAFVFDWNRFVVDDPELQPFYNFGFWNLLLPAYRAERPIPTPYLNDLPALSSFLASHGVRFFVLPKNPNQLQRFPALLQLLQGQAQLPGFQLETTLAWDVVFVRG